MAKDLHSHSPPSIISVCTHSHSTRVTTTRSSYRLELINVCVCVFTISDIEGVMNPTLMKDPSTSPVSDRKKQRRKKNLNQRADTTLGPAEGQNVSYNTCNTPNTPYKI